jgi:hypothetical protein
MLIRNNGFCVPTLIFYFIFTVIFGFLLATLTATSFGLPVRPSTWNHSCGHAVRNKSHTQRPGVRHGVAKMIRVVKDQIGVAISHLKNEKKNIRFFYNEVSFRLK